MSIYVRINPWDKRIHVICDACGINKIALAYAEAKRDALAHRETHQEREVA